MRFGLIISSMLHASLVLFVIYGLPHFIEPLKPDEEPLLIELVTIGEITTPQVPPKPEEKPLAETEKATEPEPKKEEPKETPLPPPPNVAAPPPPPKLAMAQPTPTPKVEAPPPPPMPAPPKLAEAPPPPPLPAMEKKPKVAPAPAKLAMASPPPPEAKPAPPPPPPPPSPKPTATPTPPVPNVPKPPPGKVFEKQTLSKIAALLDKKKTPSPPTEHRKAAEPVRRNAPTGPPQIASGADRRDMTIREIDALRLIIQKQIENCWTVPAGARDAADLVVRVHFYLNPDGTLVQPPEVVNDGQRGPGGEFFRTAAESARRAVLTCTPLRDLPVESYDYWREVTLNFNPKELLQ